jgi:hypothetical protein
MAYISIQKTITGRLFSKNGYLTLTLPVGTHTILISKILVNIFYAFLYFVAFYIGVFVLFGGFAKIVNIGELLGGIGDIFAGVFERFAVLLIETLYYLLCFVFALCVILFCNSVANSGLIRKQSKVLNFIILIIFIISLSYIMSFEIIPYDLYYDQLENRFLVSSTYLVSFYATHVFNFSTILWLLLGTAGFYFGSYYLIKNKIDII